MVKTVAIKARNLTAEGERGTQRDKTLRTPLLCGDFKPLKNRDNKRDVYFSSPKFRIYVVSRSISVLQSSSGQLKI